MKTLLIVTVLVAVLAGPGSAAVESGGEADSRVSGDEALRESLRETELAFAASVKNRDPEAFAAFIAADAVFVGAVVHRGKETIVAEWQTFFTPEGPVLEWWPEVVEIGDGKDIGLTRGPYRMTYVDAEGHEHVAEGLFNSVWRLQDDGTWRVVFDAGCE